MSGVKNNVGRGINIALVNGKWYFKGADCFHFKIVSEMEGEILWGGERQAPRRKGSIQLIYTEKTSDTGTDTSLQSRKTQCIFASENGL